MRRSIPRVLFLLLFCAGLGAVPVCGQEGSVKLKVVSELANIRLKPDIGSVIIRQFPQESILQSREKVGEWYKVYFEVEGGEPLAGYVHESLVLVVEGSLIETEVVEKPGFKKGEKKAEEEEKIPVEKSAVKKPSAKKGEPEKPATQERIPQRTPELHAELEADLRFKVFLFGGGNYSRIGDLNSGSQGLADYYSDFLGVSGRGPISNLRLTMMFGGDLVFPSSDKLSVIIGADYFSGGRESLVDFTAGPLPRNFTSYPRIKALPVRVGLAFFPAPFIYVKAAAEFVFAQCRYFYRFQEGESWQQWEGEAKSNGLGAVGGLGVIFRLNSFLGLYVEAGGRYTRLKGFEGTNQYTDSDGGDTSETGNLYIYQGQITGSKTYPLLFIRDKVPSEAGVSDPKEAVLDLTGVTLKAGVRIRF